MKQAFALLALVAAIQGCTGSFASNGVPGRRQRRSHVPREDDFLEKSSSSLTTVELWSRLHNAESLAETERQVLVAQQEALQALQREQEALALREAKTEAFVEGPLTSEIALSQLDGGRSQRITHGVAFSVNKQHTGNRPGFFSRLRTRLASLLGRQAHRGSAGHKEDSVHEGSVGNAEEKRHSEMVFLAKNSHKQREAGKSFLREAFSKRLWYQVGALGFCVVQAFIIAVIYEQCCKMAYPKLPEGAIKEEEWQFGLFQTRGCARDWRICLFSFCCPSARWADTVSRLQPPVMGFLPALFVFSLLSGASALTFGASTVILFLVVVLSRVRIREAYGISHGELGILTDCLIYCCCAPCAIAQEARQIEYVTPIPMDY